MSESRQQKSRKRSKIKMQPVVSSSLSRTDYGWVVYTTPNCKKCKKITKIMKTDGVKHKEILITDDIEIFQSFLGIDKFIRPPWIFYNGAFFGGYKEFIDYISGLEDFNLVNASSADNDLSYIPISLLRYAALFYLAEKFPDACVIQPNIGLNDEKNTFIWDGDKNILSAPRSVLSKFKQCLAKNSLYILMYLKVEWPSSNSAHANFLIYDTRRKQMERFEPEFFGNNKRVELDDALLSYFNKKIPGLIQKYFTPVDYIPLYNYQMFQQWENVDVPNDPGGFCLAWSIWYADMRMTYPDIPREKLIEMATKKLTLHPKLLTGYIRDYAAFLHRYMEKVYKVDIKPIENGLILYSKKNQNVDDTLETLNMFNLKYTHEILSNKVSKNFIKKYIGVGSLPILKYNGIPYSPTWFNQMKDIANPGWHIYSVNIIKQLEMYDKIYEFLENNGLKPFGTYFHPDDENMINLLTSSYSGQDLTGIWPRVYKDGVYVGSNLVEIFEFIRRNKM